MVGVDRHQCPEIGDQLGSNPWRLAVAVPAVDDPVPDCRQVVPVEPPISQPTQQGIERGDVVRQIIPALFEGFAAGVREAQTAAPAPDPARLRPQLRGLRRVLPQAVQGGLQAGRTGVDRQQTPCAHDARHLSRSGTRFYTGCRWWITWLWYRHFASPGNVLGLHVLYTPQIDLVPPAIVNEPDEGIVAAWAANDGAQIPHHVDLASPSLPILPHCRTRESRRAESNR